MALNQITCYLSQSILQSNIANGPLKEHSTCWMQRTALCFWMVLHLLLFCEEHVEALTCMVSR